MFKNVVIGLKEELRHGPLLDLAKKAAPAPARLHLVTLVRFGTNEDELPRLRKMEEKLEGHAEALRSEGYEVSYLSAVIVVAAAADLNRIAEEREADLLVIGLGKRTRVGKALMGSDAQRVLLSATCPVLSTQIDVE